MKTTISIFSFLEHEILNWAINSDSFGEAESNFPFGWSSWDRTAILDSGHLVLDWETPHMASYAAFILLRLHDLHQDAKDEYARVAKDMERRLRHALKFQVASPGAKMPDGDALLFKTARR